MNQLNVKTGAVAVTFGSVAVVGFGAGHGVLPNGSGQDVLRFVADHPHYAGVHFGSILGVIFLAGGITALPSTFVRPIASSLARLGVVAAVVGAAVFVIQFAIDGYGHHALAAAWIDAPPPEQADLARTVEVMDILLEGPAFAWIALLWGLPLILFGLAVTLDERYPNWQGVAGTALGIASLSAATIRFLQSTVLPDGLVFAVATLGGALWALTLGIMMWRRNPETTMVGNSIGRQAADSR